MDSIALLVSALEAGAVAIQQPNVNPAIHTAYTNLRALLTRKYPDLRLDNLHTDAQRQQLTDALHHRATEDNDLLQATLMLVHAFTALSPNQAAIIGVKLDNVTANTITIGDIIVNINQLPPPLRIPNQSPRRVEHFVDRTTELADLVRDIQPGRVLTLTGPGGMGKTALVAQAIHHLAQDNTLLTRFPDGIVFHDFYVEPAADQALSHIARTYNEPIERDGLQSAARRALSSRTALLLDGAENCDHLDRVTDIAGRCSVIITTRRLSDAPAAATMVLPPLPQDDAVTLIAQWAQLIVDKPTSPNITPATADAPTIPTPPPSSAIAGKGRDGDLTRIADFVGYLPLALRLIGRYLFQNHEDPAAYLSWLQETPLDALGEGKKRSDDSIPYLIERSLRFVDDDGRQILAVAGAFAFAPIPFALLALALDNTETNLRRPLAQLVDHGFLQKQTEGGYIFTHALIHAYAHYNMIAPLNNLNHVVEHYTYLFKETPQIGIDGIAQLHPHRLHLIAIVNQCKLRSAWSAVQQLVNAAEDYFSIAGYWNESIELIEVGITAAHSQGNPEAEGDLLASLGRMYYFLGRLEQSIGYHRQALVIAKQVNDTYGEGICLGNLALAYRDLGQVDNAIAHIQNALEIFQRLGNARLEGFVLSSLGNIQRDLGQIQNAMEHHRQALEISTQIGNKQSAGNDYGNIGLVYYILGKLAQAIDYFHRALKASQDIGDRLMESRALGNLK